MDVRRGKYELPLPQFVEFLKQLFQKHRAETVARSFHASTYLWVALFENRHPISSIQFVISGTRKLIARCSNVLRRSVQQILPQNDALDALALAAVFWNVVVFPSEFPSFPS